MLRIGYVGIQILIVFCSLLFNDANAARHKDFGTQNNIYLTEWARLKHQAELGDPDALFVLGNYYYQPPTGSSFRKNLKKSAEFYFKAGIRGNAAAQYNFALMLLKGLGVTNNAIESYVWFKLASNNQSPVAKHINQLAKKAVTTIEAQMNEKQLLLAKEKVNFYTRLIREKRYRNAKYPG